MRFRRSLEPRKVLCRSALLEVRKSRGGVEGSMASESNGNLRNPVESSTFYRTFIGAV